jgi:hypothetical protein
LAVEVVLQPPRREKSFSGGADVTRRASSFVVTARWPREREDRSLRESRWLKSLLGRTVNNWRELVDAIDWRWVLKRVEELADELKPWIGPEKMSDVEREGLGEEDAGRAGSPRPLRRGQEGHGRQQNGVRRESRGWRRRWRR